MVTTICLSSIIKPSADIPAATCNTPLFPMLKAVFLGVPQIHHNHHALTGMLTKRSLALFAYLVVSKQPQDRSHLADLLWADIGEQQARQNLRYVLYELRKLVGDYLVITRDTLTFVQQKPSWVDANIFTTHVTQATTCADPVLLQNVLQLYQGEFLTGFSIQNAPVFEDWLLQQRQQFQQQAIRGLLRLSEQHLAHGDYISGLATTARLLQLAPWQEEAHRYQMRFLAYTGQRLDALAQYVTCCQSLQDEYNVAPEEATTQLYHAIEAGELFHSAASAHKEAAARVLQVNWDAIPHLNHMLGRQTELGQLQHWITQPPHRVIGLFGLAGQGKSALGAELVVQIAEEAAAGDQASPLAIKTIIWSTLTTLPSLAHLLEEWLAQLSKSTVPMPVHLPSSEQLSLVTAPKTHEKNVEQLLQQLLEQLRRRRVLLILDGGETLYGHSGPWTECQPGWEAFDELLRRLADNEHRSCLLFVSRVMPTLWDVLARRCSAVRTLTLSGLTVHDSVALLRSTNSADGTTTLQELAAQCAGHPQTLVTLRELLHSFGSDLLALPSFSEPFLANPLLRTLHAHFTRFAPIEQTILLHLATLPAPQTAATLWPQLANVGTPVAYLEGLLTLQRHHWLLPSAANEPLGLSPLIKRFIEQHILVAPAEKSGATSWSLLDQVTALRLRRSVSAEPERQHRVEASKAVAAVPNTPFPLLPQALPYALSHTDIRSLPV